MATRQTATSTLRDEHQVILQVVGVLEELLSREAMSGEWDFEAVADCVSFFRLFADACHHGQEEDLLFPELQARGLSGDAGPIAVMLHEHRLGRGFVAGMADSLDGARQGDAEAAQRLRASAQAYIDLIRGHIHKEDNILFAMADRMVAGPECDRLCEAYGVVCQRHFEGHTKEQLERVASDLVRRVPPGG